MQSSAVAAGKPGEREEGLPQNIDEYRADGSWVERQDPTTGRAFYFNLFTYESTYAIPKKVLHLDWEVMQDPHSRRLFFYHRNKRRSQWELPPSSDFVSPEQSLRLWDQAWDERSQRKFWHNPATGESRWDDGSRKNPSISDSVTEGYSAPGALSEAASDGDWRVMTDNVRGRVFYYNVATGESQWERPEQCSATATIQLSADTTKWEKLRNPQTGRVFFFHRVDGIVQWERPAELGPAGESPPVSPRTGQNTEPEWEELFDPESQQPFYFNRINGTSTWEKPETNDTWSAPTERGNASDSDGEVAVQVMQEKSSEQANDERDAFAFPRAPRERWSSAAANAVARPLTPVAPQKRSSLGVNALPGLDTDAEKTGQLNGRRPSAGIEAFISTSDAAANEQDGRRTSVGTDAFAPAQTNLDAFTERRASAGADACTVVESFRDKRQPSVSTEAIPSLAPATAQLSNQASKRHSVHADAFLPDTFSEQAIRRTSVRADTFLRDADASKRRPSVSAEAIPSLAPATAQLSNEASKRHSVHADAFLQDTFSEQATRRTSVPADTFSGAATGTKSQVSIDPDAFVLAPPLPSEHDAPDGVQVSQAPPPLSRAREESVGAEAFLILTPESDQAEEQVLLGRERNVTTIETTPIAPTDASLVEKATFSSDANRQAPLEVSLPQVSIDSPSPNTAEETTPAIPSPPHPEFARRASLAANGLLAADSRNQVPSPRAEAGAAENREEKEETGVEKMHLATGKETGQAHGNESPQIGIQDLWKECVDKATGRTYYFNKQTRECQWVDPRASKIVQGGWVEMKDESSGRTYFYNPATGESKWRLDNARSAETTEHLPSEAAEETSPIETPVEVSGGENFPTGDASTCSGAKDGAVQDESQVQDSSSFAPQQLFENTDPILSNHSSKHDDKDKFSSMSSNWSYFSEKYADIMSDGSAGKKKKPFINTTTRSQDKKPVTSPMGKSSGQAASLHDFSPFAAAAAAATPTLSKKESQDDAESLDSAMLACIAPPSHPPPPNASPNYVAPRPPISPPPAPGPAGKYSAVPDEFLPERVFSALNKSESAQIVASQNASSVSHISTAPINNPAAAAALAFPEKPNYPLMSPASLSGYSANAGRQSTSSAGVGFLNVGLSDNHGEKAAAAGSPDSRSIFTDASGSIAAELRKFGSLEKRARHSKQTWQARWFVLDSKFLRYYESERHAGRLNARASIGQPITSSETGTPLAKIDLRQIKKVEASDSNEFALQGNGALGILMMLRAPSVAEANDWVRELSMLTQRSAPLMSPHLSRRFSSDTHVLASVGPLESPQNDAYGPSTLFARCVKGFKTQEPGVLSYQAGDMIRVLERNQSPWMGECNGRIGSFDPENITLVGNANLGESAHERGTDGGETWHTPSAFQDDGATSESGGSGFGIAFGLRHKKGAAGSAAFSDVERRIENRRQRQRLERIVEKLQLEPMKRLETYPTEEVLSAHREQLQVMNARNHKLKAEVKGLEWRLYNNLGQTSSSHASSASLGGGVEPQGPNAYLLVSYSKLLGALQGKPKLLVEICANLKVEAQYIMASTLANSLFDQHSGPEEAFIDVLSASIEMLWDQGLPSFQLMRNKRQETCTGPSALSSVRDDTDSQLIQDAHLLGQATARGGGGQGKSDDKQPLMPALLVAFVQRNECRAYLDTVLASIREDFAHLLISVGDAGVKVHELASLLLDTVTNDAGLNLMPAGLVRIGSMLAQIGGGVSTLYRFLFEVLYVPALFDPRFLPSKSEIEQDPVLLQRVKQRMDMLAEFLCYDVAQAAEAGNTLALPASLRVLARLVTKLSRKIRGPVEHSNGTLRPSSAGSAASRGSLFSGNGQFALSHKPPQLCDLVVVSCFELFMLHLAVVSFARRFRNRELPQELINALRELGEPQQLPELPDSNPYLVLRLPKVAYTYSLADRPMGLSQTALNALIRARSKMDSVHDEWNPARDPELLSALEAALPTAEQALAEQRRLQKGTELVQRYYGELALQKERLLSKMRAMFSLRVSDADVARVFAEAAHSARLAVATGDDSVPSGRGRRRSSASTYASAFDQGEFPVCSSQSQRQQSNEPGLVASIRANPFFIKSSQVPSALPGSPLANTSLRHPPKSPMALTPSRPDLQPGRAVSGIGNGSDHQSASSRTSRGAVDENDDNPLATLLATVFSPLKLAQEAGNGPP